MNKKILIACLILLLSIIFIMLIEATKNLSKEPLKESSKEFSESSNDSINGLEDVITEQKSLSEKIIIKDKENQIENATNSVDIIIPEIQNLEEPFKNHINNKLFEELSYNAVYANATEGFESGDVGLFTYEVNYDRFNSNNFLSIVAKQYIHFGNGRPRMQKKCYVIDIEKSTIITLIDIFKNKLDYEKAIIAEVNKQAEEKQIELIGGNGLNKLSSNQQFYIKDNKLIIYFESSEIAATAVGELEFVMPFEMIGNEFII